MNIFYICILPPSQTYLESKLTDKTIRGQEDSDGWGPVDCSLKGSFEESQRPRFREDLLADTCYVDIFQLLARQTF